MMDRGSFERRTGGDVNGRKWPRKGQPHQRAALGGQLKPIGLCKIARDGGFLWISSSLLLYRNTSHRRPTSLAVGVPGKRRLEAGRTHQL